MEQIGLTIVIISMLLAFANFVGFGPGPWEGGKYETGWDWFKSRPQWAQNILWGYAALCTIGYTSWVIILIKFAWEVAKDLHVS